MREPEINKDYALVRVYKCWHCDYMNGFTSNIEGHIKEKHPETLHGV